MLDSVVNEVLDLHELNWLYELVACATVLAASTLALIFAFWPPVPKRK